MIILRQIGPKGYPDYFFKWINPSHGCATKCATNLYFQSALRPHSAESVDSDFLKFHQNPLLNLLNAKSEGFFQIHAAVSIVVGRK